MRVLRLVLGLAVLMALLPTAARGATVAFTGSGVDRQLSVTAGDGRDRGIVVDLRLVAATVDVDEQITVSGGFATTLQAGAGCTLLQTTKEGVVTRSAVCKVPRGVPVVIDLGGGVDDARITGDVRGVEVPAGRSAITLRGGAGDDSLQSQAAAARSVQAPDPVVIEGGSGDDRLSTRDGAATLVGGDGADVLAGASGPDVLRGGAGSDDLQGDAGDDALDGGLGGDLIDGGEGADTVAYRDGTRSGGVTVTLDARCDDGGAEDTRPSVAINGTVAGPCSLNGVDRDLVTGIETVIGSAGADTLVGGPATDQLFGEGGDDLVEGAGGADTLVGGAGADTLLARDERPDAQVVCQGVTFPTPTNPGDRAVLDAFDPADPDCTTIERGGANVVGPADDRPAPTPPPPGVAAPPPPPVAPPVAPPTGLLNGGSELGTLPGGAFAGRPPQARIVTRRATADRRGRIAIRIACVYQARACASRLTLRTRRAVRVRSGRRTVRLAANTVVGRAVRTVPWGGSASVSLTLPARLRTVLARSRRPVALRLTAVVRDSGQGAAAVPVTIRGDVLVGARRTR